MNPLNTAAVFLVKTAFDLYLYVLILRFFLVVARVDFYNPISQFVVKLTQGIVRPLRKIIPNYKHIECATLIWIFIFECAKFYLLGLIFLKMPNILGIAVLAIATMAQVGLLFIFYGILIQAILSWVQQGYSPIGQLLNQIINPITRPFQRLIPAIGGVDITPIFIMLGIQLILIVGVEPILGIGQMMAFK